jgi:hypothetical protein
MTKQRYKPTQLSHSGRLVRKAARILRDRKWLRGDTGSKERGMCAIGAISFAATGQTNTTLISPELIDEFVSGASRYIPKQIIEANLAVKHFGQWLANSGYGYQGGSSVPDWNDHKARDKEEVILYMEKFADEVDPQRP